VEILNVLLRVVPEFGGEYELAHTQLLVQGLCRLALIGLAFASKLSAQRLAIQIYVIDLGRCIQVFDIRTCLSIPNLQEQNQFQGQA
jgi:hypothetical protein